MGLHAGYTAVPPHLVQKAQRDETLWGALSFDPPEVYPACRLGVSWSSLWYLLDPEARRAENPTRPSNPLGRAIMGAHVFGRHVCLHGQHRRDVENAYGHPRDLDADEVDEAAGAMASITRNTLFEHYDPGAMRRRVYSVIDEPTAWGSFERLRAFYSGAAGRREAVIVHIW